MDNQTVVITGGASGIGAASVRAFAAAGADVFFGDIADAAAAQIAGENPERITYRRTDVRKEQAVEALIALAHATTGRLDCLFNNAGILGRYRSIANHTADDVALLFDINFKSIVWGMKHAAPIMKALGGGAIINTASVSACQAGFGPHLYTAAKHAVLGLTRSVATELAAFGITVNALCPGGTLTQLAVDAAGGGAEGRRNAEVYLADLQPLKTVGLPEDMAQAALFLASPSARFMTGQALIVDGGATAGRPWNPGFEV